MNENEKDRGFALLFVATRKYVHNERGAIRYFERREDAYAYRQGHLVKDAAIWIVPHPSRALPTFAQASARQ